MAGLLERLGSFAARRPWVIFPIWVIILGGLLIGNHYAGGEYVNNYNIPGTESLNGLNRLNDTFASQGGYAGQIVYRTKHGTFTSPEQAAVNQVTSNVAKLPDVIKSVSPFSPQGAGAIAKDKTIAYTAVSWSANPYSLNTSYLNRLNSAVAPARTAGLQVEYGNGAGNIGQTESDKVSEAIGLACALVLLLFMFGSLLAAAIPLVSALFSVGAGLSLLGLLAAAMTFPTTAPTVATLLGLGVAIDYGLFLTARHREQLDTGMNYVKSARHAEATSGAAIVVAGSTVVVSILGLYISGVSFVGAIGLAAAIVVALTMAAALTLVPAFMGVVRENVRALSVRIKAHKAGETAQEQARRTAAATHAQHEHGAFARWGRMVSRKPWPWLLLSVVVLLVLAIPLLSIYLGQPDNGTNPTSQTNRRAYDLMTQGFGVGSNGPLAVVVVLPKQSAAATSSLLSTMQKNVAATKNVASVGPAAINSASTTAVFNVIPDTRPQAGQTTALVNTLRATVLPKSHVTTYVTGTSAGQIDFTNKIKSRLLWLILAVIAISFVLLTCAFRHRDQGGRAQPALDRRVLRRDRGDLRVGLGREPDRPAHDAADSRLRADGRIRHRVRPVHGLRGFPAVAGARGLAPDPRPAPVGRDRHRQHRARDHHRGRDHGRGIQQLRGQLRPGGQDARDRHGLRRADRRLDRPDDPGALGDDAARREGVVDAEVPGAGGAAPAAGGRRWRLAGACRGSRQSAAAVARVARYGAILRWRGGGVRR
jgi:RND superfamily putative drug exporter